MGVSPPFADPQRWAVVDRLLNAALDLPPAEQRAFVEREAAGDPELVAAVLRLLRASSAPSVLDEGSGEVRDAMLRQAVRDWEAEPPDVPTVPRYRIARELGRGGMGTVYLATRADGAFSQQVAVKVLRRGVDTDDVLTRFRRERQILASFEHPNIARVLDGGAATDGRPYLVMEYVDGVPLDAWCANRQSSTRQRLTLFRTLCTAVEYAHRKLVVHRDIKPSNVLVAADGVPKLLDFGIAKLLGGEPDAEERGPAPAQDTGHETGSGSRRPTPSHAGGLHTRTGLVYATPRYASPEQLRGEPVNTSTDVYQLGILLYELLTGAHPTGNAAHSVDTLRQAILSGTISAPSKLSGQSALRGDLDAIILKALRPDAGDRYGSVSALREDVDRYLRGDAVLARSGAGWYRLRRSVWRHRAALGLTAVALVAATTYVVSLRRYATELEVERNRAELAAAQSAQTTNFLVELFRTPSDTLESRGDTVSARTLLTRGAERVQLELAEQPAVRASLLAAIGTAANYMGLADVRGLLDAEIDALEEAYGETDPRLLEGLRRQAWLYNGNRHFTDAAKQFDRALRLATAYPVSDSLRGDLLLGYGNTLVFNDQPDSAAVVLTAAVEVLGRSPTQHAAKLLNARSALASVERRRGNLERADTLLRSALADAAGDVARSPLLNNLGSLMRLQGRLEESSRFYGQALAAVRGSADPSSANRNTVAMNYASVLVERGQHDMALTVLREELVSERATFPADHWRVGRAVGAVAQTLTSAKRPTEALPYHDEQLTIYTNALGAYHAFTLRARADRAVTLRVLGQVAEAERTLLEVEASATRLEREAKRAGVLRFTREQLAALYASTDRPDRAARYRALLDGK